ncbi:MAG: DNA cytosine methyltransferase [Lentisphaeraceae bacterium]|nr:DNA cytosine methyltransferase [Lentisphaeraceae bacterium]
MKTITAVDMFCGAGGSSTGLEQACEKLGYKLELSAINHWNKAIETHAANHPEQGHYCMNLDSIEPRKVVDGQLDILIASPECTHHSNARGGKPKSDQSRASAFRVTDLVEALRPKVLWVENVREFMNWGPLDDHGKPIKKLAGKTFNAWIAVLESLGYHVSYRVINCADYGDPTTRKRFFLLASRGGKVNFPVASHVAPDQMKFSPDQKDWVPARDIIDWSIEGKSIFDRKKPLAKKTLDRIWRGMEKFCKDEFRPFLTMMYGNSDSTSLENPLPTITAESVHHYLAEPFLVNISHSKAKPSGMIRSIEEPMQTQVTREELALCEPFILGQHSCSAPRNVSKPLMTVATAGAISIIEPFLVQFYGTSEEACLGKPLPTITCKDRFGLVQQFGVDIRFRMLKPHELSAAMSFPRDYQFSGNQSERVKQIGNAVPVATAQALACELLKCVSKMKNVKKSKREKVS